MSLSHIHANTSVSGAHKEATQLFRTINSDRINESLDKGKSEIEAC